MEVIPFHAARKAPALRHAGDPKKIAGGEAAHVHAVADGRSTGRNAELVQMGSFGKSLQVSLFRLVQALRAAESELDRIVARAKEELC